MADRAPKLGLDAELERKRRETYDPKLEEVARTWLEAVVGHKLEGSNFHEQLKSGIVLCEAVNAIKPGSVKKINKMKQPFMMMENIDSYIKACRSLGVPDPELFMTVDLYEEQNMNQVLQNVFSLYRVGATKHGFSGPTLTRESGFVSPPVRPMTPPRTVSPSRQRSGSQSTPQQVKEALSPQVSQPKPSAPSPVVTARPQSVTASPAPVSSPTTGTPKFCSECGAARTAAAKFCNECGTKF